MLRLTASDPVKKRLVKSSLIPHPAVITDIKTEAFEVDTYTIAFKNPEAQKAFRFDPGQYNMISLPGIGEAPISISSSPKRRDAFEHTVRIVGRVTTALSRLKTGDTIGVRGPYGHPWPVEKLQDKNVAVIIGGTGCACIKPAINLLVDHQEEVESATILYGAKTPQELLYAAEFEKWQESGVNLHLTVDEGHRLDWPFHTGVVTTLFDKLPPPGKNSMALVSGPDTMMRFCLGDLMKRGWHPENLWLSLERRMECAVGLCGHCQLGPKYVCRDGPVFNYAKVQHLFGVVA